MNLIRAIISATPAERHYATEMIVCDYHEIRRIFRNVFIAAMHLLDALQWATSSRRCEKQELSLCFKNIKNRSPSEQKRWPELS